MLGSRWVKMVALFLMTGLWTGATPPSGGEPPGMITFNDDGGWCWFQDERVIVHDGKLIIGSVAAGVRDPGRKGNVEVTTYDIATGAGKISVLRHGLQLDDHDVPALLTRPDARILAVYSKHGNENHFYYRVSTHPNDSTHWQVERTFTPSESSRITYSNLHRLGRENYERGRIYNFYRGLDASNKPSYAYSDDGGQTWISGNVIVNVPTEYKHRPYVKYASNGEDTVHMFYTDGHPRNFDNSTYHIYYRGGWLHRSDGQRIRELTEGLTDPSEGTRVFKGDADNVAWVSDIHLDGKGNPYVAYSVQKGSGGLPAGRHGADHRYRYARWTGSQWIDFEIAYAGSRLYPGEDDYTGNIALHPNDPNTLYISANVEPTTGKPLVSKADNRRHYEIFKGVTTDGGGTWEWTAVTKNSPVDNIRPVVPKWDSDKTALLWLRGAYRSYTNYDLAIVGIISASR